MFFLLDRDELMAWGWRVPFLASVAVMLFAIWLRRNLKESPVFEGANDPGNKQKTGPEKNRHSAFLEERPFGSPPDCVLGRRVTRG